MLLDLFQVDETLYLIVGSEFGLVSPVQTAMKAGSFQQRHLRTLAAVLCLGLLVQGNSSCSSKTTPQSQQPASSPASAQSPANQQSASADQPPAKIPADQLDSLVAPIALYPDPLVSQVLVASTYPLELIQLQQWLEKNKDLKDQALVNAVSKQPWDPSIQAMAPLPEVVKRLADDVQWTTDLGNAFLAQQSDVMDAVQRMRQKAQGTGALKSNEQVRVETKVVESKTIIVIEQASPEVVYVPVYDPVYVYGPPVYPYPAIYYPAYPTGTVIAASAISFGVGVALGAAWGGGWGWGCGWGDNDIDINVNNNFNRNTNISGGNRTNISGGNKWQHNPRHRGGAPYPNRATADRFGGPARGDSLANRQKGARQQLDRQGGINRGEAGDRGAVGNRSGVGDRSAVGDRASSRGGARASDRSRAEGNRGSGASSRGGDRASDRSRSSGDRSRSASNRGGGGPDRVGSRNVGSGSGDRGVFEGSRSGGSGARASSSRGASSMGGSRGSSGGGSRGGFSGGGGARGGGGGRGGGRRR